MTTTARLAPPEAERYWTIRPNDIAGNVVPALDGNMSTAHIKMSERERKSSWKCCAVAPPVQVRFGKLRMRYFTPLRGRRRGEFQQRRTINGSTRELAGAVQAAGQPISATTVTLFAAGAAAPAKLAEGKTDRKSVV